MSKYKEDKLIDIQDIVAVLIVVSFSLILGVISSPGDLRGIIPLIISGVILSVMLYSLVLGLRIKFKYEDRNNREDKGILSE